MNISVDGGALCASQKGFLGTSIFSSNLIKALSKYDKKNSYEVYTFCKVKKAPNISFVQLPKKGFMKFGITTREMVTQRDIFLALNQSSPVIKKSKIISFCHGLSYMKFPHLYPGLYNKLFEQLNQMVKRSDAIVTSSCDVKKNLLHLYPDLSMPIYDLPFGIPFDFQTTKTRKRQNYFLYVGSNAPVKNLDFLVSAFLGLKLPDFKLYLVGQHSKYLHEKNVKVISDIGRQNLKKLYQEAACYLMTSHYESFNIPILEALSQSCPVLATEGAVISEFKPFVKVAKDSGEFQKYLKQAAQMKIDYNNHNLTEVFSWKKYVKELTIIYETLSHRAYQK